MYCITLTFYAHFLKMSLKTNILACSCCDIMNCGAVHMPDVLKRWQLVIKYQKSIDHNDYTFPNQWVRSIATSYLLCIESKALAIIIFYAAGSTLFKEAYVELCHQPSKNVVSFIASFTNILLGVITVHGSTYWSKSTLFKNALTFSTVDSLTLKSNV